MKNEISAPKGSTESSTIFHLYGNKKHKKPMANIVDPYISSFFLIKWLNIYNLEAIWLWNLVVITFVYNK